MGFFFFFTLQSSAVREAEKGGQSQRLPDSSCMGDESYSKRPEFGGCEESQNGSLLWQESKKEAASPCRLRRELQRSTPREMAFKYLPISAFPGVDLGGITEIRKRPEKKIVSPD